MVKQYKTLYIGQLNPVVSFSNKRVTGGKRKKMRDKRERKERGEKGEKERKVEKVEKERGKGKKRVREKGK